MWFTFIFGFLSGGALVSGIALLDGGSLIDGAIGCVLSLFIVVWLHVMGRLGKPEADGSTE